MLVAPTQLASLPRQLCARAQCTPSRCCLWTPGPGLFVPCCAQLLLLWSLMLCACMYSCTHLLVSSGLCA